MDKDKYFGYARKSLDDKEDTKTSINNQVEFIKKTAKELNVELVKVFIDSNISGSDRERKEFLNMEKEIYSSDVKGVIVKEQDRFARDSSFFRDKLIDFDVRGKKVYSAMRKKFLSFEDLGDMVTSVVDDNYIVIQRKKADLLMEQKKDNSMPMFRPPFGYKMGNDKNFKVSKRQSEIVNQVLQDYVNKVHYKIILKRYKISRGIYDRIQENAWKGIYSGFIYYVRKHKDSNKKIVREEEIKYKGTHKPIISEELFNQINRIKYNGN